MAREFRVVWGLDAQCFHCPTNTTPCFHPRQTWQEMKPGLCYGPTLDFFFLGSCHAPSQATM